MEVAEGASLVARTNDKCPDLEASIIADSEPLLGLPSFMPPSRSPQELSPTAMSTQTDTSASGVPPDAWPGGRNVCYAFRCLNLSYGAYLVLIASTLAVGLYANGGDSCARALVVWASVEILFCALGVLNVLWKHKRVPQLVVDRNAGPSGDMFIATSRITLTDMCAVHGGAVLNVAWIVWLILGCIWTFGEYDCSDTAPVLMRTLSLVIEAHLVVVGMLAAVIMCAASALPVAYLLRPELFLGPPRGATKSLIDRTTKRSTYQAHQQRQRVDTTYACDKESLKEEKGEEEVKKEEKEKEEAEEACAICLSEYEANEEVRELPCGHVFHARCAEAWLQTNKTCAACRRPIDC